MSKKIRILVVEDETRMRANLVTILRMEGFEAIDAADGAAGVDAAKRLLPDLILCDISMPRMDGHAVLSALRDEPATARIPFIFLTARGDKVDVRSGMNLGADDYLVKPVEIDELLSAIQARLERRQQFTPGATPKAEPTPAMLLSLGLTEREEVLFWAAQGKTNPELCVLLDLQLTTVKKHLASIFQKLGVENRTAAAAMALEKFNAQ